MNNAPDSTYLIILAGGTGSRFWPMSRIQKPKQFQDVLGTGKSLLQQTYERFNGICPPENVYVITHQDYVELVREHLPGVSRENILVEPFRRNTAPCIAYASHKIKSINPESTCIVTPSDHLVLNQVAFEKSLHSAIKAANDDEKLVTIGIQPTRPDTGFGYIQFHESNEPIKKAKTFTEKPEKNLAVKFLESGDFVWNSGIFVWRIRAICHALALHLPEINESFTEILDSLNTEGESKAIQKAYSHITNMSIDYGVLEKSSNVYVVPGEFGWSDLGTWEALHTISDHDADHNTLRANTLLYKTTNTLVNGPKDTMIVVQGLDNYLVSLSENVLIICRRGEDEPMRQILSDIRSMKGRDYL